MPWEQNERSLQINTHVRDAKDMSDIKEKIQIGLDIMNSNSTKMRTSIENSAHKNLLTSNENQEGDNLKSDMCKEINGTDMLDKKVIELDNQHLKEANLLPQVSENGRDSSTFLNISSPDIIANDELQDTPKKKKNISAIGDSNKIKRSSKSLDKSNLVVNNISPNKKFKFSSINEIKNNDKNLINKNENVPIIDEDVKSSYSSPSLFDDSLNLDTQMCNILEQNITDVEHLTGLDSKVFVSKLDSTDTLQKESTSSNTVQLCAENNTKSIGATNLHFKNSILSWDDDSWNNSEMLKQMVQNQNIMQCKKEICNSKIRNIENTNESIILKNTKTCTRNSKDSVHKMDVKKHTATLKEKMPRKSKLPKITKVYKKERKMSVDSNKSDSDDFIVDSQHFESPFSNNKSQMRTTLEKIRKLRSQKLAEETVAKVHNHLSSTKEKSNNVTKDEIKEAEEEKVKPNLKEDSAQNILISANCSVDSIIYNSENETTNNLTKTTLKMRRHETQSDNLNKNMKFNTEKITSDKKKDLLNETIDWNTLNIVKVANNRATFNLFKREVLKKRNIALALHCETYVDNTNNIGSKICASNTEGKRKPRRSGNFAHGNKEICGIAIAWESNIAYYLSFNNSQGNRNLRIFSVNAF